MSTLNSSFIMQDDDIIETFDVTLLMTDSMIALVNFRHASTGL